ncbi:MAG: hypothetical protein KDJ65_07525 [Anaerolineae bacterium]|nr:hypothetical protein [Anaerolineae bacterium]
MTVYDTVNGSQCWGLFRRFNSNLMTPVVGIELDDGSHKQFKRKQRNRFMAA